MRFVLKISSHRHSLTLQGPSQYFFCSFSHPRHRPPLPFPPRRIQVLISSRNLGRPNIKSHPTLADEMLALSSLLNPIPSESSSHSQPLPSPTISSPATSCADVTASAASSRPERPILSKHKMSRDSLPLSKSRPRGVINYPPYEDLDDDSLKEVQKFQVTPFGQIRHCCAHIPYNSGKKDFFVKTGRESFEGLLTSRVTSQVN